MTSTLLRLTDILSKEFNISSHLVTEDKNFLSDFNLDSIDMANMSLAIEEEFKIDFPLTHFQSIQNIKQLVEYLNA